MFQQLIFTTYSLPSGMGECDIISTDTSASAELAIWHSNPKT